MLFKLSNRGQPKKLMPNKRQRTARLSSRICCSFSALGFLIFWLGFKLAPPPGMSSAQLHVLHTQSVLVPFHRPQPHLLVTHATIAQVDKYVNISSTLGSMRYEETAACKKYSSCEIHFPFVDLSSGDHDTGNLLNALGRSDYGVLTLKGYKALVTDVKANQDRVFLISPMELSEESSVPSGPDDFIMGLFDGHGPVGHGTSHFAAMELPPIILQNMKRRKRFIPAKGEAEAIKSAIKDAYIELDEGLPFLETSGSTGIVILRIGSYLFMASTGDSQAFLVRADPSQSVEDGVSIVKSTEPHKPDNPLESARIRSAGGQVIPKMGGDSSSRVVIPFGTEGFTMALAMSRCIGDPEGKEANLIIADPNVDIIDLNELKANGGSGDQYFVVVASDGLLDHVPPEEVAKRIAKSFYQDVPSNPLEACRELIQISSTEWMAGPGQQYRDDISIAVKKIDL